MMTSDDASWSPDEVDLAQPSVARVYDFYLGGSHNFASDRAFGREVLEAFPTLPSVLRDNREFLRRAVLYLGQQGVDQFLDLGSGIPTVGNVHEVAQAANPHARIVYVDHDPVAIAHSNALLQDNPLATAVAGDIREPARVLDTAVATGLIDLSRPLAVMLVSVMHFVPDEARPIELIDQFMAPTAPGSFLALSHACDWQAELTDVAERYNRADSPGRMRLRSRAEVEALFGGLTIVPPGLELMPLWRPDLTGDTSRQVEPDYPGLAGVGRRD
ncbi:MAG: SAM-dependent methyltransferase [Nocardioidaceae bacterium]